MSENKIYLVETAMTVRSLVGAPSLSENKRLIRAPSRAAAIAFVRDQLIAARLATQIDLVRYLPEGVEDVPESNPTVTPENYDTTGVL